MSILKVSIAQLKAARALVGWSQDDLARAAGVSLPTVKRLEAAGGALQGRVETANSLMTALQREGVQFIEENGGGPGVRLRKRSQNKKN
jgi:transcriptional regulator with XRE-family HTH domain